MGAIKDSVTAEGGSAFRKYQDTIVGTRSLGTLLHFEVSQLVAGHVAGALGLALRQVLYRGLFARCGKGVVFGRDVVLRQPGRIELGRGVVVDDGCCLDAISDQDPALVLGDRVMLGMGTKLSSKMGSIRVGDDTGFGANVTVHAALQGRVDIGKKVLIAGGVYIGGGMYHNARTDIPMADQGHIAGLGLTIEDHCWIGANATIVNGVRIGRDSIVAAGAVVTKDVAPYSVVGGVPARVLRMRTADGSG